MKLPAYRTSTPYSGTGAMTDEQIEGFVAYRQAYQQRLAAWMAEEGVDAVVFPGQLSNIHLNDSVAPSFGRLDPQSSNAGVPTAIFPAGTNSDGQPGNLQLEGPAFSDAELLGMAYAFEQHAHGHVETTYAPALSYDPDSVAEPISVTPAPPTESEPPASTPPATTKPAPMAKLLKGKLHKGKFVLKFRCTSISGPCSFVVRLSVGHLSMPLRQVKVGAGKKKTISLKPSRKLKRKLAKSKAKVVVTMIPVTGSEVAAKHSRFAIKR